MKELRQITAFLNFSRLFNIILYGLSIFLSRITKRAIVLNQPYGISIEASATCNMNCSECPLATRQNNRQNPIMSTESFKQIIEKVHKSTFYLNLYFQGEPLMDKNIFEKIKIAHDRKMFVSLSTNSLLLNEETNKKLIDSELSKIIISADGATQNSIEKYRTKANLDHIIKNIKNLKKLKKESNKKTPLIEVQMIVFKHNESEIDLYKTIMKKAGAEIITFKSPQFYSTDHAEKQMSTIKKYQRYKRNSEGRIVLQSRKKKICKRLWHTILINSDGEIPLCCFDKNIENKIAKLKDGNLSEIWKNPKYNLYRNNFLKGKKASICNNCE